MSAPLAILVCALALSSCWRASPTVRVAAAGPAAMHASIAAGSDYRCIVVDEQGDPLAGVLARLRSDDGEWSSPPPDPHLLDAVSDARGVCSFAVPATKSRRVTLDLVPDRFHALTTHPVGANVPPGMPPLAPLSNMDPPITIRSAGAISGRVVDARGEPVAGATVAVQRATTRTSADGTFEIGHVVPGRVSLRVTAPKRARHALDVDVREAGQVLAIPDVRLAD